MELKQLQEAQIQAMQAELLIVPYGIETNAQICEHITYQLLIVPYGIETHYYMLKVVMVAVF